MVVGEASFLTKDLGDVRGESLGVVVVVVVVVEVAPASGEASMSLEAGKVRCSRPGVVLGPRGRLEIEPGGVVGPRGDLPTFEGTILFLGAAEEAAAGGGVLVMAGEVLLEPGEIFLLPGEGLFVPVVFAFPARDVAAAGEGVVVVVFIVLDGAVVGGVLPVVRPLLGRSVGDNGGQRVARLPATAARVVLVAVVEDVAGDVLFSGPLLSEPPELLGLGFVVLTRVGASRPGNSGGEGAHPRGVLPRELTLGLRELLGLPPPLLRRIGGVGGHEEARSRATDARVVLVFVLLEGDVVLAVAELLVTAPLLSAPSELLGEGCIVLFRVGASRPGNSEGEGAPAIGEVPGGLVRRVVTVVVLVAGTLVSPLVDGV